MILEPWRCPHCSRILAKLKLGPGSQIEIKCSSCSRFSTREAIESERTARANGAIVGAAD